jgi:hypothetical protein
MAYEQKDMTGSLFKNERKESDSHPDYNGSCMIGGVAYWQNVWLNKDKNGKTYMSFKYKPKEDKRSAPAPARVAAPADMDDEIPF